MGKEDKGQGGAGPVVAVFDHVTEELALVEALL
jgi:hypothetical protein